MFGVSKDFNRGVLLVVVIAMFMIIAIIVFGFQLLSMGIKITNEAEQQLKEALDEVEISTQEVGTSQNKISVESASSIKEDVLHYFWVGIAIIALFMIVILYKLVCMERLMMQLIKDSKMDLEKIECPFAEKQIKEIVNKVSLKKKASQS